MPRIYFYKLTADNGGAPCVQGGLLSLAICKPFIRTTARRDDLIFGFAANSLHRDNRLIYIARVTERVAKGDYYTTPRFSRRRDRIYEKSGDEFRWRAGALYHSQRQRTRDLGPHPRYPRADVVLSSDFRYFGANGNAGYKDQYPRIRAAVEHLGQGHRVHHGEELRTELQGLKRQLWNEVRRKVAGKQASGPRPGACDRSRACGVVGKSERS